MSLLLPIGAVLVLVGCAGLAHFAVQSGGGLIGKSFHRYQLRLERHAGFLFLRYSGMQIARAQLIGALLGFWFFLLTAEAPPLLLAGMIAFLPPVFLSKRHVARVAKLEAQLDTWLMMLANALKSTPSLGEAIASTRALMPRPFAEELDLLVKELRLGAPLDRALNQTAKRIGSPIISGAVMLLSVARQTGGDLSTTLERAAAALRESARLEGVLRTKTAEGRGQVLVLALVPFLLSFVIAWLDPSWFDPMLLNPHGRGVLAACAIAWLFSVVWAHHIVGAEL